MSARVIPIRVSEDSDQDLIDARTLIDHLDWFEDHEHKAMWLALVLRSRRMEIEFKAGVKALRSIMEGRP